MKSPRQPEQVRHDILTTMVKGGGKLRKGVLERRANFIYSNPNQLKVYDDLFKNGLLEIKAFPICKNSNRQSPKRTANFVVLTDKAIKLGWV